ncbi:UbiE family methyltransferase [Schizosaccharomyces cryophilus OY26]|uniref:UbiE family methyltransferase n=1 Tax=Schizosaccharomyces cryophilus (strain OY26 / ATCC MYA-4695 / CBS 11777 / NBRC 106824 / NRRL Y48691) TaxID=653667 RepID=S9VYY8_SCHCR|nr:UbiE family methyltransferase [Schizosaccharomyces cryophilus OY26]EPY51040.1 UbiE family methyltransferase [Schizosaccharomyces cryophilus OY26]
MSTEQGYYAKGFDSSISKTHAWRTVENSCAYLIRYIKDNDKVLDVGCGPGTITMDLARRYVPKGEVIGVEPIQEFVDAGNLKRSEMNLKNCHFQFASGDKLPFEDNTFDIVHAHQVLVHVENQVDVLKEMKRVTKPGGIVCSKDADLETSQVYPTKLDETLKSQFLAKTKCSSTHPQAGRHLRKWAIDSGFSPMSISSSASLWFIANEEDRKWFGKMFRDRALHSTETLIPFDAEGDLRKRQEVAQAWDDFIRDSSSCYYLMHGEVVCKK